MNFRELIILIANLTSLKIDNFVLLKSAKQHNIYNIQKKTFKDK